MGKREVYCFDFDGTLTDRDSLLCFIRHSQGTWRFLTGFMMYSPSLILMVLRLMPNWRVKQMLFRHFFEGWSVERFDGACRRFAEEFQPHIRPKGLLALQEAVSKGAVTMVVSASVDNWVRPCVNNDSVIVLGTRVEVVDGVLTGHFSSRNCYGQEKVNRIKAALGEELRDCHVVAFGDSRGDKEMLAFAAEGHFKPFRDE